MTAASKTHLLHHLLRGFRLLLDLVDLGEQVLYGRLGVLDVAPPLLRGPDLRPHMVRDVAVGNQNFLEKTVRKRVSMDFGGV